MRNTDDQLREILKRADDVKEQKASRKAALSYALSACACVLLIVVTAVYLPGISAVESAQMNEQYGSLLLKTAYMGHVVIAVLAFLLGVCVTLLCLQLRESKKKGA